MSEYIKLKTFWNDVLKNDEAEKVDGKWVTYDSFNNAIKEFIKDDAVLLDYGCGQGWASFEIYFTVKLNKCLGIDTSSNAIDYCNRVVKESNLNNMVFKCNDETLLDEYINYFDNIVSFNVLDVLPDDVIESILSKWQKALKKNGIIIVGINPDFPKDFLEERGYLIENNHLYKDGILRGNEKDINTWNKLFSKYFRVLDNRLFSLQEMEEKYPRRMFILTSK